MYHLEVIGSVVNAIATIKEHTTFKGIPVTSLGRLSKIKKNKK